MLMAIVATVLLFLIMVMLIQFSYLERTEPVSTFVNPVISEPIKLEEDISIIVKLQNETKKLKEIVSLPPAVATKTSIRSPLPPTQNAERVTFAPSFNLSKPLDLHATLPAALPSKGRNSSTENGASGLRKGFGDTADIGGERQCTIIFEVGKTIQDIAELQWIDCVNKKIVDDTETALNVWIKSGSEGYLKLNPMPGESIEFTYEQK